MLRRSPRALLGALLPSLVLSLVSGSAAFAAWGDGVPVSALPIADALAPTVDPLTADDRLPARSSTLASEFVVRGSGERSTPTAAPAPPDTYAGQSADPHRLEAVSYRPRHSTYRPPSAWHAVTQLHAGFMDPDGPATSAFDMGFRGGHEIDHIFQIGVGLDWRTKSGGSEVFLHSSTGPGGELVQTQIQVSHFSSNLLPLMAYGQLSGPNWRLSPYVGGAGSWQVLFLSADDYASGQRFSATYSGFGWQAWGGVALRLTGAVKLVGEAFMNGGTVSRDVYDPIYGFVVRESIRTDGIGARYGMSWGF